MQVTFHGLHSFAAMVIFVLIFFVPVYHLILLSRVPSLFYRRPWRVVLTLAVLALAAPAAGFLLVAVLTVVFNLFGSSLLSGEEGMRMYFAPIVAGALYFLAAVVFALVTLVRGHRKERG